MNILERDMGNTAIHEAGHVVACYVLGYKDVCACVVENPRHEPIEKLSTEKLLDEKLSIGWCYHPRLKPRDNGIVAFSGIIAELFDEDNEIDCYTVFDYLRDDIVDLSATDWLGIGESFFFDSFSAELFREMSDGRKLRKMFNLIKKSIEIVSHNWFVIEFVASKLLAEKVFNICDIADMQTELAAEVANDEAGK